MQQTVFHMQRLAACGVSWRSHTEPLLCADNELVRDIVLAVMASLAKIEAQKISTHTKAGSQRARAKGKVLGRPPICSETDAAVRRMLAEGVGILKTARLCGCGTGTVQRIKEELKSV